MRLLWSRDLKRGGTIRSPNTTVIVKRNLTLRFSTNIALEEIENTLCQQFWKSFSNATNLGFPVCKCSVFQCKPALPPCFEFTTEFGQVATLFQLVVIPVKCRDSQHGYWLRYYCSIRFTSRSIVVGWKSVVIRNSRFVAIIYLKIYRKLVTIRT